MAIPSGGTGFRDISTSAHDRPVAYFASAAHANPVRVQDQSGNPMAVAAESGPSVFTLPPGSAKHDPEYCATDDGDWLWTQLSHEQSADFNESGAARALTDARLPIFSYHARLIAEAENGAQVVARGGCFNRAVDASQVLPVCGAPPTSPPPARGGAPRTAL